MGMPVHRGGPRFISLRPIELVPELDPTTAITSGDATFRRMRCDGSECTTMCMFGKRAPLNVPYEKVLAANNTNEATIVRDTETLPDTLALVEESILFLS